MRLHLLFMAGLFMIGILPTKAAISRTADNQSMSSIGAWYGLSDFGENNNPQLFALLNNSFLNPQKSIYRAYELAGTSLTDEPWSNSNLNLPSGACCPDFILSDAIDICPPDGACPPGGTRPDQGAAHAMAACKNTIHKYTVFPKDPAFTYVWTITGGTPASYTGNPVYITWGGGAVGTIKVVISNAATGGTCLDSITQNICLIDGPRADFTVSTDTTCVNTPVHFTNTSLGGSVFFWDFGDGNTSNLANPLDHAYSAPGTYNVLLVAQDMGAGHGVAGSQGADQKVACGCIDSIWKTIVVLPGVGPVIDYDCCFGTVCAGDTSSFCTPMVCGTYNWSVTNGTIISGLNTSCIKVKWNATYTIPTTVSLQSCATSTCPGTATLNVPVLYPNLPINGPNTVCVGSSGSYSLPWLPGTYYTWTVTGPGLNTFNQKDRNTTNVNITFSAPGPHWVKCEYDNPLAGCNGVDSMMVNVLPKMAITGDLVVCEGNTTSYSVTAGPANWSVSPPGPFISGNGNQTVGVTWAPPGEYVLTAVSLTPGVFCNDTAYLKVKVVAKPILGPITGLNTVCPGTKTSYGITSNVSGSPFVWTISTGSGSIPSQMGADNDSIVVDWGTGPWVLSVYQNVEISPGVFCPSNTQFLPVNPYPVPVPSGPGTVCIDDLVNYTVTGTPPPGGFQWTILPANSGTIQSGQGSASVFIQWHGPPTTATVKVSNCSGSGTMPVVINGIPTPVASYNMTPVFCQGSVQTLGLSTANIPGYSYQWYLNGSPVPFATNANLNVNIAPLAIGIYQYYVIVTVNGCSAKSNIINVYVNDCTPGSPGGPPVGCICDAIPYFQTYVVCGNITLINQSTVQAPNTITNYLWTVSGPGTGVFSPSDTVPNPSLTVNASGLYTITLTVTSSSGCSCTYTAYANVFLPNASFTYTSPVCMNSPALFSANPGGPANSYAWNFGDTATSFVANTQHSYNYASPPPFNVTLIIKDPYGCIATASNPVVVNPKPVCTITASDTTICPGSFAILTACNGMTSYQWYKNGNPINLATGQTFNAYEHGEYWVVMTNSFGCSEKSNKIYIYLLAPPVAKITGNGYVCSYPSTTEVISLATVYKPSYSYSWSSNPPGAIFTPANFFSPSISVNLPAALPVTYQFMVDVTDTITGCTASDTMCVTFYRKPPLTVTNLNTCEPASVVLTPAPNNTTLFDYLWNNGQTTPVITASKPGFYSLTITNKSTGCSTTANAGFIHAKPDLSLFPLGCDSICSTDTLHMYIPLPLDALGVNSTYPGAYISIDWYDNGNYGTPVGSGQSFPFVTNVLGSHQLSVVVTNSHNCVDTAGVFCLNVRNCPPYYGVDFGDVPDDDVLPGDFPTLLASNGARHLISPSVYLGSKVDAEANGQPSFMAVCDDNDCFFVSSGDDEDGVSIPSNVYQGSTVSITVVASVPGYLDAWMDFNLNMDWSDAGDHIFTNQLLAAGSNTLTFTVPATATPGQSYARFRFRTANNIINFYGLEQDGEVEDYAVHIDLPPGEQLDFGDVPDDPTNPNDFPTLLSSNGARHAVVPNIYLGSLIDTESDGQPTVPADGDDVNNTDDEDGVAIPAVIVQGSTVSVIVTASVSGYLDAWMDFNGNSNWANTGEHIFNNVALTAGANSLSLTVPLAAMTGPSYARFRFHTANGTVNYDGWVADGEVEDYAVYIEPVPGTFDFGDVPDDDIITTDFPTLLASNGARHLISPNVYLGSKIDAESDGQPSYLAVCDDNDCFYVSSGDDEDGVNMPSTAVQGATITLTVVASTAGYLDAWMDFNLDSDWSTAGEHIFTNQLLSAGSNTLTFTIPATASPGISYSRFRFRTSSSPISFFGLVADGEVEDYSTVIKTTGGGENLDFGDVPDDPSNPSDFPTLLASNGARHTIVSGVFLGSLIDAETNGQPTALADGDDLNTLDDEDGVIIPTYITVGTTVNITVMASVAGFLDAWIDYNGNGIWGAGLEHIFTNQPVSAGSNALSFAVPSGTALGQSYARFRFRTSSASISFNGLVADGEVEDYPVHFDPQVQESLDFGDVPDNVQVTTDYPTLLASNGARHLISPNVYLGSLIDAEANGQPNITATGDDATGVNDEDGVTIPSVITIGSSVSITVVASVSGFLDAWIDYNVDGDWADAGEHVFTNQALSAGSNSLSINVPATATSGQSYSRFRFRTSSASISYDGQVNDGEVEDYATYLEPAPQGSIDLGDAPDNWDIPNDYPTLLVSNGARHTIVPGVYMGTLIDAESDGQPNNPSTGDDINNTDDEDGVTMPSFIIQGATVGINVVASTSGFLDAWIDYNLDGNWTAANEHVFSSQALAPGSNPLTFTVPLTASMGQSYSRFRFRTSNAPISYDGLVSNGEVEDYAVYIEGSPQQNIDFGDVPDNPGNATDFPTLLSSNGARHTIANNTFLGTLIDGEANGLPTVAANGDNTSGLNDEDGVTFLWPLSPGNPCKIKVVASVNNAFLNMWIDYNGNGTWVEAAEHVLTDVVPVAGVNYYTFIVPLSALPGPTYMRFRYSHQPALGYSGLASDGEVEDYRVVVQKTSHKWHQLPDEALPGLHSDQTNVVADDWVCNGGVVTEFDWFGNYELLAGAENRGDGINHFQVTAYSDASCLPESVVLDYDVPLSSIQEVSTGSVNSEGSNIYKYVFILPLPYDQQITHTYWLSVRAIPNNPAAPASWRWQEASRVFQPVHCPSCSIGATGSWEPVFWPDPTPGAYSDMAFSVINSQSKTMNLKVYLEGLYAGDGVMHKAQDENGDHFPGTTADQITVELHDPGNYSQVKYTISNVNLTTSGDISVSPIPEALNGSYYVTIKHRNSIETTTANPVSFHDSEISYDFTTSATKAYGGNLLPVQGAFAIFGGDMNQDGLVDSSDMIDVDNDGAAFSAGYIATDINGDGLVDSSDMIIIDNNATGFIGAILP